MEKGKKTVKIVSHKRSSEFGKPTKIPSASARSQRSDDEIEFQISDASPQYSSTSFLTTLEDESEQQENNLRPQILDVLGEYFDELDDDEFLSEVNEVLDTFKHLNLENKILEMFLNNNEPSLLATLPKARAMIQDLQETAPLLPDFFNAPETPITPEMMLFTEGLRINVSQVSDLLLRYVEEMQKSLDSFIAEALKQRKKFKAEIEQCSIWISEIEDASNTFEETVVQAVDPLTQRIPAEKFVWYMHDWLKSARLITEKIRLRNASMKIQLNKLKALYVYKKEVGVSLCDIDFEGLRIENDSHLETIEEKNAHLIELKRITGAANLDLTTKKNYLSQLQIGIEDIVSAIKSVAEQTVFNTDESLKAEKQLDISKEAYDAVVVTVKSCRAPAIMDYVRVKAEKHELEKQLKILLRQHSLVEIALKAYIKKMMNLTRSNKLKPEWLTLENTDDVDIFLLEHPTERDSDEESEDEGPICDIFEALNINIDKGERKEQKVEATKKKKSRRVLIKKRPKAAVFQSEPSAERDEKKSDKSSETTDKSSEKTDKSSENAKKRKQGVKERRQTLTTGNFKKFLNKN